MIRRFQRWLFWIFLAWFAFQIYVVREWLAVVLLAAVACAAIAVLVAFGLLLREAWQACRSRLATLRGLLGEPFAESAIPADSNTPPQ
jgi:hypothetical protein